MAVMERSELEASPLADLHAIADQVGLDGFRRLRKAELIDAILRRTHGESAAEDSNELQDDEAEDAEEPAGGEEAEDEAEGEADGEGEGEGTEAETERGRAGARGGAARRSSGEGTARRRRGGGRSRRSRTASEEPASEERAEAPARRFAGESREDGPPRRAAAPETIAEGVVELLGNGSGFLRVQPPEPSDDDVYISAAQVRRCELVSGDRVSGPVRTPRRSERYPSLARIDTINGASAEAVAEGPRYDDLPAAHPATRLELDAGDPTLKAIEWLTPIGLGSRALITGPARAGKTEALRRILGALAGREGLELTLVLAGVRPEEVGDWQQGPVAPAAVVSFAAGPDAQGQAVEHAIDSARRVAVRGADAVVLIDGLDGVHPHVARRALAAARNLIEGGSLTVIATAARPFGGESTVIALDVALTSTGRLPALDLVNSGTLRPELLVGEQEAQAIDRARAAALGVG
jgi:transcription termination factor Rho